MTEEKPYVGDVGTLIEVSVGVDLTGVATLRLDMTKPDASTVQWTGTIKTDATSVIQYTVEAGDFDIAGTWSGQAYAYWDAANVWSGETFSFELFALGT